VTLYQEKTNGDKIYKFRRISMYLIPGFLISIITFPGVIIHEFAHQLFCRLCNVAVLDVCYFRFGNPAGYVVHEQPRKASQNILIGVGPFFVNSIIGALIAVPAAIPVLKFNTGTPLDYFLIWVGVSIAMHSFPSTGDAKSIWSSVKDDNNSILLKIIAAPIVGIIYIFAFGSYFWLDLAYGVALVLLLPNLLIKMLA
jgi:hypothetical protein